MLATNVGCPRIVHTQRDEGWWHRKRFVFKAHDDKTSTIRLACTGTINLTKKKMLHHTVYCTPLWYSTTEKQSPPNNKLYFLHAHRTHHLYPPPPPPPAGRPRLLLVEETRLHVQNVAVSLLLRPHLLDQLLTFDNYPVQTV